jgi:hypothetical protein
MITTGATAKLHWNYFAALEQDLDAVARYVEFSTQNFGTYSIELAHLLFAAASEVDVVAKLLCALVSPPLPRANISQYKAALLPGIPELPTTTVFIPRYGLSFEPFSSWSGRSNPGWWRSYNNVKHQRDSHFHEATLQHALNAMGGLLILNFHLYSRKLAVPPLPTLDAKETTSALQPTISLLRLSEDLYYDNLVV